MKTIVTTKMNRRNLTCNISGVNVSFNLELEAQVEDSVAEMLLEKDPSLSLKDGKKNDSKKSDKNDSKGKTEGSDSTSDDNGNDDGKNEDSTSDYEMRSELMEMTMKDLKEMVANLPESEWKGLKKAELVEYIIKNTGK